MTIKCKGLRAYLDGIERLRIKTAHETGVRYGMALEKIPTSILNVLPDVRSVLPFPGTPTMIALGARVRDVCLQD